MKVYHVFCSLIGNMYKYTLFSKLVFVVFICLSLGDFWNFQFSPYMLSLSNISSNFTAEHYWNLFLFPVYWSCQSIARPSNSSLKHWQQMGGVNINQDMIIDKSIHRSINSRSSVLKVEQHFLSTFYFFTMSMLVELCVEMYNLV